VTEKPLSYPDVHWDGSVRKRPFKHDLKTSTWGIKMSSTRKPFADRHERQSRVISSDLLSKYPVAVVGVGAIGRQVAVQLAVIGVSPIVLIDGDLVTPIHLGSHGFREEDVGKPKVDATAEWIRQLNGDIEVHANYRRFHRTDDVGMVLFCCVDNSETRGHIFRSVSEKSKFFIDARTDGESVRILTICNKRAALYYPNSLFRSRDMIRASRESQATFYAAGAAAGIMVAHYARWLRGQKPQMEIVLDLQRDELMTNVPFHKPRITLRRLIAARESVLQQ
jgi:sulfur carrier protein ThiS adenylyltransferase